MARKDLTALSRTMSHALRHEPWLYELELELDAEGWTPVEALLAALRAERKDWKDLAAEDFAEVIRTSSKRRYEMADGRIRALYGHSVPGKLARTIHFAGWPRSTSARKHPQPVRLIVNAADAARRARAFAIHRDRRLKTWG